MSTLLDGLKVTLIGILIVFFGLTILIMLIKALIASTGNLGKKKETPEQAAPVATVTAVQEAETAADEVNDEETVAAIMAALSCVMENGSGFTVRHIRRIRA